MIEYWEGLSQRERILALTVAGLLLAGLVMLTTTRALSRVSELDSEIDRLEQDLLKYKTLEARGVSVDRAFAEVAAQHSSAWTKAEIHNMLRKEMYRLAAEDPDAPPGTSEALVEIPALGQGSLKEGGAGYREYQLAIRLPLTDVYSLVIFMVRLMQSPQSLRIDEVEISRSPESTFIRATIVVTRTIVDGAPATEEAAETGLPARTIVETDGSEKKSWTAEGCRLSIASAIGDLYPDGGSCLRAESAKQGASLFMTQELESGATYDLVVDAAVKGKAVLQVVNEADGQPFEGGEELPADGKMYRHCVRFTVPGEANGPVKLRVPHIALKGLDTEVYVDNVLLAQTALE